MVDKEVYGIIRFFFLVYEGCLYICIYGKFLVSYGVMNLMVFKYILF